MKTVTTLIAVWIGLFNTFASAKSSVCDERLCYNSKTAEICDRSLSTCPPCMEVSALSGKVVCTETNFIGSCSVFGSGPPKCGKYKPPTDSSGSGSGGSITTRPTIAPASSSSGSSSSSLRTTKPTTTAPVVTPKITTATPKTTTPVVTTAPTTPIPVTKESATDTKDNAAENSSSSGGLGIGTIVAIACGAVVVVALIILGVVKYRRSQDDDSDDEDKGHGAYKPQPNTTMNYTNHVNTSSAAAVGYASQDSSITATDRAAAMRAKLEPNNSPQVPVDLWGNMRYESSKISTQSSPTRVTAPEVITSPSGNARVLDRISGTAMSATLSPSVGNSTRVNNQHTSLIDRSPRDNDTRLSVEF